ncbi:uncharacterized protein LOC124169078 [Ischnura elegans]|uniref:uncharacterized protein LOC124169078 n=1 Tax=Ischnura elegans TaxID=197161 RepID=UPI001ED8AF4B|nr:uncharacterized protein LOC124169078 [Ischnura elegans]
MESTSMAIALILSIILAAGAGGELLYDHPRQMNLALPDIPMPPVKLNLPTLPKFTSISEPKCGADAKNSYGCCIRLEPSGDDVCLSFITDLETLSVELALTVSGVKRLSTKITGSSLPPLCLPVPQYPLLQFCGSLSNVSVENEAVKFCSRMEVKMPITIVRVDFDCLKIGKDGLDIAYVSK